MWFCGDWNNVVWWRDLRGKNWGTTGCLAKMAILCMWGILAKTNKYKIIVPRWRYSKLPYKNDLSPSKMLRCLTTFLIMVIRWPAPIPFTSKDKVAYQTNGKTTMSKEKKMNKKDIWVGRLLLITCSISKQTSLLFQKQTPTLSKTPFKLENIFKRLTLCIHSYERELL